jgi:hypothetical protein
MTNPNAIEKPLPPIPASAAAETEAITKVTDALMPLTDEARGRVMWFIGSYFRIGGYGRW